MVLKKSNSALTSRATQRVRSLQSARRQEGNSFPTHCLILAPGALPPSTEEKGLLQRQQCAVSTAQALVLDYFNQNCPQVNEHGMAMTTKFGENHLDGHLFPVNKVWESDFQSTFCRMKRDADFAKEVSQFVDLQIYTYREHPLATDHRIQRSKWSAFDFSTSVLPRDESECDRYLQLSGVSQDKTRPKTKAKARGVQRPCQLGKQRLKAGTKKEERVRPEFSMYVEVYVPEMKGVKGYCTHSNREVLTRPQHKATKQKFKKLKFEGENDIVQHGLWVTDPLFCYSEQSSDNFNQDDILLSDCNEIDDLNCGFQLCNFEVRNQKELKSEFNIMDFYLTTQPKQTRKRRRKNSNQTSNENIAQDDFSMKRCKSFEDSDEQQKDNFLYEANDKTSEKDFLPSEGEPDLPASSSELSKEPGSQVNPVEEFDFTIPNEVLVPVETLDGGIRQASVQDEDGTKYIVEHGNCSPVCFVVHFLDARDKSRAMLENVMLVGRQLLSSHWALRVVWKINEQSLWYSKLQKSFTSCLASLPKSSLPCVLKELNALIMKFEPVHIAEKNLQNKYAYTDSGLSPSRYFICTHEEALNVLPTRPPATAIDQEAVFLFSMDAQANKDICGVCFQSPEDVGPSDTLLNLQPCGHSFCLTCWRTQAYHCLREGRISIGCLETGCQSEANAAMMKALLPDSLWQRWHLRHRDRQLELSPITSWCPGCPRVLLLADGVPQGCQVTCHCGIQFCHTCRGEPHWPVTCQQYQTYVNSNVRKTLTKFEMGSVADIVLRPCPKCSYPIEKNGGCNSMFCVRCRSSFDWSKVSDQVYTMKNEALAAGNDEAISCLVRCENIKLSLQRLESEDVRLWVHRLSKAIKSRSHIAGLPRGTIDDQRRVKQETFYIAQDAVVLLKEIFTVSHIIFLHLSVLKQAYPEKARNSAQVKEVEKLLKQLDIVIHRLEKSVIEKSMVDLFRRQRICRYFLETGRRKLDELKNVVKDWQPLTECQLDVSWLQSATLEDYLRF